MTIKDACRTLGIKDVSKEDTIGGRTLGYKEGLPNPPGGYCQCMHVAQGKLLYCFVRHFKPKVILEIGRGAYGCATAHMALALDRNDNGGMIYTYDLGPCDWHFMPNGLQSYVKDHLMDAEYADLPADADMVVEDGAHTFSFQVNMHRQMKRQLPAGIPVWVHDVNCPVCGHEVMSGTVAARGAPEHVFDVDDGFTGLGLWRN